MKLKRDFYIRPALDCMDDFLGKELVHETPLGKISGIIYDVEAYPAFSDEVHHGNKRTPRTEVMWGKGGFAYIYLIYGTWHQFAVVMNKKNIPDVIFIRGILPLNGKEIMQTQWDKPRDEKTLTNSPGKLCKSMLITKKLYGADLTNSPLYLKDRGVKITKTAMQTSPRIGIRSCHKGYDRLWRYFVDPSAIIG